MMITIRQGEDLKLEIPVIGNQNDPINLTTATKIRMSIAKTKNYMDATLEGNVLLPNYASCSVNTTKNNVIDVLLVRNDTKTFPVGELSVTVLLEFPDVDLTVRRYEYTYNLGSVEKGYLRDELL